MMSKGASAGAQGYSAPDSVPFYYNDFPRRRGIEAQRDRSKSSYWFTYERMRLSTTCDDRLVGGFKSGP